MNNKIITAFSKLINSDVIKNIYPMIDHVDIVSLHESSRHKGYNLSINIFLNDPSITKDNMYTSNFDPHYLAEKHIKDLSKYLGIDLNYIGFKLFGPDKDLILNWD